MTYYQRAYNNGKSSASLAFDKSAVVKEYKEEIEQLKKAKDKTSKKLGEMIVERDFVVEKLKSLVSSKQRAKAVNTKLSISLNRQLQLLSISKVANSGCFSKLSLKNSILLCTSNTF